MDELKDLLNSEGFKERLETSIRLLESEIRRARDSLLELSPRKISNYTIITKALEEFIETRRKDIEELRRLL